MRFRVISQDGKSGSSWKISTTPSADVVLTHREAGQWIHATLHTKDPEWHFALDRSRSEAPPDAPSYVGAIRNHEPFAPGWFYAARITVPVEELRSDWEEHARHRSVVEVVPTPGYESVAIGVLLGDPGRADTPYAPFVIGELARSDGGTALVIAQPAHLDAPIRISHRAEIEEAIAEIRGSGKWDGRSNARFALFGVSDDGFLQEIEVALDANIRSVQPKKT